jgi:DNA repair protein RadC
MPLGKLSISQLMVLGIGEAKALIIAALELGRRRRSEDAVEFKNYFQQNDFRDYATDNMNCRTKNFDCLSLNNSNKTFKNRN